MFPWTCPIQKGHFGPRIKRMCKATIPCQVKHQCPLGGDGKCKIGDTFQGPAATTPLVANRVIVEKCACNPFNQLET